MRTHDVVVIGAGAMGSAASRSLAAAGREVVTLEKYGLGHDRGGSHGGTRLFRAAVDDEHYLLEVRRAGRMWAELEEESGERLLELTGGLDHGVGERAVERFRSLFTRHGVAHEVLDPREAAERWPGMRFETPVLYQPGSGRLLADRAVAVLQRLAGRRGAEFRPGCPATALRVLTHGDGPDGGLVEVDTPDGALRARQVVVTAGAWAPRLLGGHLGLPAIVATQEQPRFFVPRGPAHGWPSFVHWREGDDRFTTAGAYGVFEQGSGVKVGLHGTGPVVDPDLRDFTPEARADRELLEYVSTWLPGLDPAGSTPISCLYDNTPRDTFVIDRKGPISVATGFCGQGFKFVPLVGHYLTALVTGRGTAPAGYALAAHAPRS
ncbi:FAD-dependent oxidoreductase [Nonomuraea sp. NPDC003804]|uniref:FAD-dependent oxidoreductase n=1 Tax=Nonomuraea sp. NPDC003804 TaxID=3154547 RepID=UPI0033A90F51